MGDDNCDFPAAHSMDTDWFAVDNDGNVALMCSCEEGAVPLGVEQYTLYDYVDDFCQATGRSLVKDENRNIDAGALGFFEFSCSIDDYGLADQEKSKFADLIESGEFPSEPLVGPYIKTASPDNPIKYSQLPDSIKTVIVQLPSFKSRSFEEVRMIQPVLDMPCECWVDERKSLRAVNEDGIIVEVPAQNRPCLSRTWWQILFGWK